MAKQNTDRKETVASAAMREMILTEATKAFATLGYHGVKVSKLCQSAGIANGTFYIYFRDKDELYQAVMKSAAAQFLSVLREAEATGDESPADADLRDLRIIVQFSEQHPWLALAVFNERGFRNEDESNVHSMLVDQRKSMIAAGQSSGSFRTDIVPELAARAEVALTAELIATWLERPDKLSRADLINELHGYRMRLLHRTEHWMQSEG